MKLIKSIVRPNKVDDVRDALEKLNIPGMTVTEVRGHGRQKGHTAVYRGKEYNVSLLPKVEIEVVVADDVAEEVIAGDHQGRAHRRNRRRARVRDCRSSTASTSGRASVMCRSSAAMRVGHFRGRTSARSPLNPPDRSRYGPADHLGGRPMKLIKSIVRPNKVDDVRDALEQVEHSGYDRDGSPGARPAEGPHGDLPRQGIPRELLPKVEIEVVVPDQRRRRSHCRDDQGRAHRRDRRRARVRAAGRARLQHPDREKRTRCESRGRIGRARSR